jgi:Rrf2 family iron-sulfur cluster assembly transcriptional regulator
MKLSTKGRYAVMAMVDIAANLEAGKNISLQTISERNNISVSYLEQLFIKLRKNKLVNSVKGPKGGYTLSREPSQIFVSDIVQAVDEKIEFLKCATEKGCAKNGLCNSHDLWSNLMINIYQYLSSISLEQVIESNYKRLEVNNKIIDMNMKGDI